MITGRGVQKKSFLGNCGKGLLDIQGCYSGKPAEIKKPSLHLRGGKGSRED
jgi:hypothetical protein